MSSNPNNAKTKDFINANNAIIPPIIGIKIVNISGINAIPIIIDGAALKNEPPGIISNIRDMIKSNTSIKYLWIGILKILLIGWVIILTILVANVNTLKILLVINVITELIILIRSPNIYFFIKLNINVNIVEIKSNNVSNTISIKFEDVRKFYA